MASTGDILDQNEEYLRTIGELYNDVNPRGYAIAQEAQRRIRAAYSAGQPVRASMSENSRPLSRSFFPAANNALATGARSTPYGGGSGNYGFGPNSGLLSPENNPAYQAAISRNPTPASMRAGGSGSGAYSWITTPSGGQMRVPTGSLGALLKPGTSLTGSQVTQIGNQAPVDRAAAYAKGYGAPAPTIQNSYTPINRPGVDAVQLSGQQLVQGGVANPVENLTPQQRIQYGVGQPLDYFRSNPALTAATNALSGFGRNIANFFTRPQGNQVQEVNQPNNFGVGGYYSQQSQPRRYFDNQSY